MSMSGPARRSLRGQWRIALLICCAPAAAAALPTVLGPPSITLPDYDRMPVGHRGKVNATSVGLSYVWGSGDVSVKDIANSTEDSGGLEIRILSVVLATTFTF